MQHFIKKIWITIYACMLSSAISAQVIDASVCTPNNHFIITKYVQFNKNTRNLSIDSVTNPSAGISFSPLPDRPVIFSGYDPFNYWFRFIIHNTDSLPKQLLLLMGPIGMRDAVLYQKTQGQWLPASRTGTKYPFSQRAYPYAHDVLPLTVPPKTTDTFYLSLDETGNFKTFAFTLLQPAALKKVENRVYFSFGIITGLLLLFFLFNIYLFISIKENIHLWYSIYLLLLIFLLMKNEGLDAEFLHLDSEAGYRLTPIMGIGALTIGILMHVVQLFLSNISKSSFLYRCTSFVKFLVFIFAIIHFVIFYWSPGYKIEKIVFELVDKATVIGVILIVINSIYSIVKGFKPAIFILAGMGIFLIGSIERLLVISTSSYLFPPSLFQIGMVIETAIISFALMYRYNQFKREKDMLAVELEKKSVEISNQIIATLESEQKRVAQDLHDDLGSNLAAIKMMVEGLRPGNGKLTHLADLIDKTSASVRNIAHNLVPPYFENTSLPELLDRFYLRLNTEGKINFHFHSTGTGHPFSKQEELMIYRIILELTNNIIKHSKATEASVQFIYYDDQLEIMVEDNGIGIGEDNFNGMGLKTIRSRLDYLRGNMNIDSGAKGTTTILQIPYNPA